MKVAGLAALSIAVLFGTGTLASAWTPPIGIPDPGFGITDVAPASTHYVDNSRACNDANSGGLGSATAPRCTIPTTLAAGSVVEVHGGPYIYNTSGPHAFIASGTAGRMVFVRGIDDGAGAPWIQGPALATTGISDRAFRTGGSYYVVEGFRFGNGTTLLPLLGGDHGVFRNNEIVNFQGPYIDYPTNTIQGTPTLGIDAYIVTHHIVIYNNHIHHNGNYLSLVDNKTHGIKISVADPTNAPDNTGGSYVWILNNEIDHNGGGALQFGDDGITNGAAWPHHIYVGFNRMHHDREGGGGAKVSRDVIFSQNDIGPYLPIPAGSINAATSTNLIVGKNGANRNWAIFNTIHDGIIGVRTNANIPPPPHPPEGDIYIIGNLITGMHSTRYDATDAHSEGAAVLGWETVNTYAVDNTIVNCDKGISFISSGYYEVTGNLVANTGNPMNFVPISWGTNKFDYNFYDSTARLAYGSTTPIMSLSQVQAYGQEMHSRQGSALLDTNYKPTSGSPAVDVSIRSSVYDTFFSLYGIGIAKDFQGVARPQGSAWDIGAYELGGQAGSPPPAPTGLSVR